MANINFSGISGLHECQKLDNGFYMGYDDQNNLWFVQPDYKDGVNLEMYIHGDGGEKILDNYGNRVGYDFTNCDGNGSGALYDTMTGKNPPNCTVCIYGGNTIYTEMGGSNHNKAVDDMGNKAYSFLENNKITINKCNYEIFSAGGNFGLEALETAIKNGHIPADATISLTVNDADLNTAKVDTQLLVNRGVYATFIGNGKGQKNTYNIAQQFAKMGFNTQHISIPNSKNGNTIGHAGINNYSIMSGVFGMMLGLNNAITVGDNGEVTITLFDKNGNVKENYNRLSDLKYLVLRASGVITHDTKIINELINKLTTCLNRSNTTGNIPTVTVTDDPTGIKGIVNGYINSFNTMKTKLYDKMKKECSAIKRYSDTLSDLDLYFPNFVASAATTGATVSTSNSSKTSNNGGSRHNSGYTGGYTSSSSSSNETPNNDTPTGDGKDPELLDVDLNKVDANYLLNKDITKRVYDITAEDLDRLFAHWAEITGDANSPIIGKGAAFIKASQESGIDPLVLVGICGKETGRGKSGGWIDNDNFFGIKYIHLNGKSYKYAGENHLFDTPRESIIACAKHIKEFYYGEHGGHTVAGLAATGYNGGVGKEKYGNDIAQIMKESLDYIVSTRTTTKV